MTGSPLEIKNNENAHYTLALYIVNVNGNVNVDLYSA